MLKKILCLSLFVAIFFNITSCTNSPAERLVSHRDGSIAEQSTPQEERSDLTGDTAPTGGLDEQSADVEISDESLDTSRGKPDATMATSNISLESTISPDETSDLTGKNDFRYFKSYYTDQYGQKIANYSYDDFCYLLDTGTKELAMLYDDSKNYKDFLEKFIDMYLPSYEDETILEPHYGQIAIIPFGSVAILNCYGFKYIGGVNFYGVLPNEKSSAVIIEIVFPETIPRKFTDSTVVGDFHGLKIGMTVEEVVEIMGANKLSSYWIMNEDNNYPALFYKEKDLYYTIDFPYNYQTHAPELSGILISKYAINPDIYIEVDYKN